MRIIRDKMYREEGNKYIFDGDLEQYLLSFGVSRAHIEKMKNKILENSLSIYYTNDSNSNTQEVEVPLEKVIGTSRGTVGKSVFDNVRIMQRTKRDPDRFEKCFAYLHNMSLEDVKESYNKSSFFPVEMDYYEEDNVYYVTSNGNHRTLVAMLIGAQNIKANVATLHCNCEIRDKIIAIRKFYSKFNIDKIIQSSIVEYYDIVFNENDNKYIICHFNAAMKNEDCYDIIKRLSKEIKIKKWKIKITFKVAEKCGDSFLSLILNKRIKKYCKEYDNYEKTHRLEVDLYEL